VPELRSNRNEPGEIESLSRSVSSHSAAAGGGSSRAIGLAVLAPGYAGRKRLEQSLADANLESTLRVVSLRTLLFLSDTVTAGRFTHEDVVRLLDSTVTLDFVGGLFEKLAHGTQPDVVEAERVPEQVESAPAFWLATVVGDAVITPERFLEVVIGKRRIFGVRGLGHPYGIVNAGDRVCFYVSDRGIVGTADVKSIESKATGLRDVHQYTQLLRLENLALHPDVPLVPDAETMLRLRAAQGDASPRLHPLMRISRQMFERLTRRETEEPAEASLHERAGIRLRRTMTPNRLNDGGSRSRE
jgi:hypothetical protein